VDLPRRIAITKHDVFDHTLHVVDQTEGDPIRRLGALLHDVGKPRAAAAAEGAARRVQLLPARVRGRRHGDAILPAA
jgi:hypothetical protein